MPTSRRQDPVQSRGQRTLDEMLGTEGKSAGSDLESECELESSVDVNEPAEGESSVDVNEPAEGGTRYFARYPLEHPSLQQFRRFLTSVDGGGCSEKTALEMAVDISKFLRYACVSSLPSPDWARLTDRDQLVGYFEKLRRVKVGPEGQLAKLDGVCMALKYLKVVIVGDKLDSPLHQSATHMEEILAGWKGTIRKEKRKLRKKRLQQLSSEDLSLSEVSLLLEYKRIWRQFDEACTQALRKQPLPTALLDQCSVGLAGSLLYKNWQRPGAVANATLEEFRGCKVVVEDGRLSYVMSVVNHKTSLDGVAKVVLEGVDHARIIQYKSTIRILQDTGKSSPLLLVLCGGHPLTNLSSRVKALGKKFGLLLPSASRVRKIGATSVALSMGNSAEAHLVTRQLSHSVATNSQYYQAIMGDKHAAVAHASMEHGTHLRGPLCCLSSSFLSSASIQKKNSRINRLQQGANERDALCARFLLLHLLAHVIRFQSREYSIYD